MQGDAHGCWYIDALLDVPESQLPSMFSKLHFKKKLKCTQVYQ